SAVGTVLGALGSLVMVMTIGLFIAIEPRLYERGLQWMVPVGARDEFAVTLARMARTLRVLLAGRLLGMLFEGVLTGILLWIAGVPMALLLGIITGILAFVPNIGAFVSGVLMVSVGFSAGTDQGLWAIAVYFGVQTFDGYVLIPLVAKRTVDLPPALTLSAQILASTLFGVLGLALADPMVAMIKVALERESERAARAGVGKERTPRGKAGDAAP
ncbi:MAG: AI-2E family transporter, partial [Sphingomonas sp.]